MNTDDPQKPHRVFPHGSVYVVDIDDDEATAPVVHKLRDYAHIIDSPVKRGRGRPKGSLAKINEDHDLTLGDFSFLRAVLQGIDAKKAALRYLSGRVYLSAAACAEYEHHIRALLQRTITVVLSESLRSQAAEHLSVLNAPILKAVAIGPSLEEFSKKWDSDMYSENELQELYIEEYGSLLSFDQQEEGRSAGYGIKAKLNAINWLSNCIAKKPHAADPIELWVDTALRPKLRLHGILTVGNLMDWVNLQGRSFHLRLKGFGLTRARRLTLWLMDNEESIGTRLNRRIRFQSADKALTMDVVVADLADVSATWVQEYGIVPMASLAWPTALMGQDGIFRSTRPNTFGASNDVEAIRAWLGTLKATASQATQISYERAVERLILWAIVERRTPLSSLVTESFVAFREFLRAPPIHWCSRFPSVKGSPDWRPLRGPMKEASVQQTFSAISALFAALTTSGYLTANAVSSVRTSSKRDLRMDVMRSFAEEDLEAIARTMREIEDSPNKRRLRAIILLLQTGGFRRGEAAGLKYGNLTQARKDNKISEVWVAKFIGKGAKERQVPIKAETYEALQTHLRDRLALMQSAGAESRRPPLAAYSGMSLENTPLLGILDDRLAQGRPATIGESSGNARVEPNLDGSLSTARIHSILKAFFKKVGERGDLVDGHANFEKASAHWLRHTFGHQAMIASGGDLASIQQILGHADISTTGIYLKANLGSRVDVIQGIKAAV
ncbi:MAG: tyrosine-type recombinase/integrase [Polaromonas sp.]